MPAFRLLCSLLATLLFVGALCRAATVVAQAEPVLSADPFTLDEELFEAKDVVITASRTEEDREDAPIATEVVTREELQASGAQNAAEALEDVHGVRVAPSVGGQSVSIQGIDARRVLVLVDGQRIAGRTDGTLDLSRMGVENIERIEVVRGSASALYGSDAMGGVIHIITREASEPWHAEASGQYGLTRGVGPGQFWSERGDNYDATGSVGLRRDSVRAQLSGSYRRADAFDRDPSDPATSGSAFEELSVHARAALSPGANVELGQRLHYRTRDTRGIDVGAAGAVYDRLTRDEEVSASLTPRFELATDGWITGRLAHSYWRSQFARDQRGDDAQDRYEQSVEQLSDVGVQLNQPVAGGGQLLSVGVDGLYQRLTSHRLSRIGSRTRISPFVQNAWTPSETPYVAVVPGLRVDVDSQYGVAISPKLAVRYDPIDTLALRMSLGRGFRAPDFKELLLRFENPTANYRVVGNPDLEPEVSYSGNLGAQWRALDTLTLSLSVFRNELRQLITTELQRLEGGTSEFSYVNVSSAYTQGTELQLTWRPLQGLSATLGYALTHSYDRERRRPLPRQALHGASARLHYTSGRQMLPTCSLRAALVGSRPRFEDVDGDGDEERRELPAYASVDVRLEQPLGPWLQLFVGVDNLLNAGSALVPLRPSTFYAGLQGRH